MHKEKFQQLKNRVLCPYCWYDKDEVVEMQVSNDFICCLNCDNYFMTEESKAELISRSEDIIKDIKEKFCFYDWCQYY